jgi:hypothetical protein
LLCEFCKIWLNKILVLTTEVVSRRNREMITSFLTQPLDCSGHYASAIPRLSR